MVWSGQATRLTLVIWGTVEILLFAGLIFGWASLVYVFKLEGFFSSVCLDEAEQWSSNSTTPSTVKLEVYKPLVHNHDNGSVSLATASPDSANTSRSLDPPTCTSQDEEFNLIYTLAVVINGVSLFATGWMFDRWGTRVCRIIGWSTYIIGTLLTAFSTPASSILLYPGIILLVFGGYFFILTNFQMGNLIPSNRATIISLYCGAYDSSAFMLVLVKFAYEAGISTRASFLFLSAMLSMVLVSTFWFMPKGRIPHPLPPDYKMDLTLPCSAASRSQSMSERNKEEDLEKEDLNDKSDTPLTPSTQDDGPTFFQVARGTLYMLDVFWLVCHRFASWSFVGRLNSALDRLADGDKTIVSHYTSVYASLQFFGIFIAPLSGRLMDRKRSGGVQTRADKVEMCIASFILDCTIGLALSITTCIPILEVQYASFVLHVIHRACLYGPNSAFIAQAFPVQHFGKLFGFAMSFAGGLSLLQYPLFRIIHGPLGGDPLMANLVTMFLMVISYAHPIYMWYWCKKQKRISAKKPVYIPAKTKEEQAESLNSPAET